MKTNSVAYKCLNTVSSPVGIAGLDPERKKNFTRCFILLLMGKFMPICLLVTDHCFNGVAVPMH